MIKEALQYVVKLAAPNVQEIKGEMWADRDLHRITYTPYADSIKMSTLTSLVDYIQSDIDPMSDRMIIHIVSPTEVRLFSELDAERRREELVIVKAQLPEFRFGSFMDNETFCISAQALFHNTPDKAKILTFAGTVEEGTITSYSDDGVSQKATVQSGITSRETRIVPNPVALAPYRTFHEVDQPLSSFIFRMRSDRGVVECALIEADGGAWKNEAMESIRAYLTDALRGTEDHFIIIA